MLRTSRPIFPLMLAGVLFLALAVFGWGVPVPDLLRVAAISLLMILFAALAGAVVVGMMLLFRRLRKRK